LLADIGELPDLVASRPGITAIGSATVSD